MATDTEQAENVLNDASEDSRVSEDSTVDKAQEESTQDLNSEENDGNPITSKRKQGNRRKEIEALKAQGLTNLIGRGDHATVKVVAMSMEDLLWRVTNEQEREKVTQKLLSDAKDRHMEMRRQLHKKVQLKYAKEQELERLDWLYRQKIMKMEELQKFIEEVKIMEKKGSPFAKQIEAVERKLDSAYELANKRRTALIKAARRHDHLDMLITRADEHERKLKETASELKRKIDLGQERRRRIKENALRSIKNAKDHFEKCVEVEANHRRLSEHLRKVEIRVFELEERVNKREDTIREVQRELRFRKQDLERAQTELLIKKQKKERGMNTKQKAH